MSLIDHFDEQAATIVALKAAEVELTDGPDAALRILGSPLDPIRMRCALGILVRANRYSAAADLVRDIRPDEKWIHLAVVAFTFIGDLRRARSLIDRADESSNPSVFRSARLGFAEGAIDKLRKQRPEASLLGPEPWSDEDIELSKMAIEILDPLLSSVRSNLRIDGDYELEAVTFAVYFAWIARDREILLRYIRWLVKHQPVPLIIAELCLRGLMDQNPESLPTRLRVEHPNDFQAALLAALIDRDLFARSQSAFDELAKLVEIAKDDDERESLSIALFETSGLCGDEKIDAAIELITNLRPSGSRFVGLLQAMKFLSNGDIQRSRQSLENVRDETDGVWWQAYAQICERSGDDEGAQNAWEKASELVPHPDVVRRSIKASIDRRQYRSVIRGAAKLLAQDPESKRHLEALAWAHMQLGDHSQALQYLRTLVNLDASNRDYRTWLAQALTRTAQVKEAVGVMQTVCEADDAPLEAILFLSELLAIDEKHEDAFQLLERIAADNWDSPRFLFSYMNRSRRANKEELAHEAFVRILELRREGKISEDLLQEGTIEQLLELGKAVRGRRESLQQAIIAGRMPWLVAENLLGNPATWAWHLHTQELKWFSEESLTRAAYSIYSTNGFTVEKSASKQLREITAPSAGSAVVLDLSALITLQKLGILEKSIQFFGSVLLPSRYGDLCAKDNDRFGLHQPSQREELLAIRQCVERGQINVRSDWPEAAHQLDEYTDDPEKSVYRLRDLIPLLRSTQRVKPARIDDLARRAHKPSTSDSERMGLKVGDTVVVSLLTLRQLTEESLLTCIVDTLSVGITESDYQELLSELRAFSSAKASKQLHSDLWNQVTEFVRRGLIKWTPLQIQVAKDEKEDIDEEISLDSSRLALEQNLPLLVDDRVLQVLFYQSSTDDSQIAFGSDQLLRAMFQSGKYEPLNASRDFLTLMNWRYRFLIPSAEFLFTWAEESLTNLPGAALLDASFYFHESLRDPGLHCGLEPSEPPIPMAAKYVIGWLHQIVTFLAKVWGDERFSDEACTTLTNWVGEECFPGCPRGLWYQEIGNNIARSGGSSVFSMAIVRMISIPKRKRANLALQTLATSLGISSAQYLALAANAIEVSMPQPGDDSSESQSGNAVTHRMMQNALYHYRGHHLDALSYSRFRELGFFEDVAPPEFPPNLLGWLRENSSRGEFGDVGGSLLFIQEGKGISVVEAEDVLVHPDSSLREAVFKYLCCGADARDCWLTSRSRDVFERHKDDLISKDDRVWRRAAIATASALREDLLAVLRSFRTSLLRSYQPGIDRFCKNAMYPTFDELIHFRPPVWNPIEQLQEIELWILEFAKMPSIEDALTGYVSRCGYVPLCQQLSASRLVTEWISFHRQHAVTWKQLWNWANQQSTPIARYHLITIALDVRQAQPTTEWAQFWKEVSEILLVGDASLDSSEFNPRWQLHCELGAHFSRYLEALHPAQNGDSAACYAWWLAKNVGDILGSDEAIAEWSLKHIASPAAYRSYFQWVAARSPVSSSPMRFATLHLNSVWAASLLTKLAAAAESIPKESIQTASKDSIARVLHGYVLTSPLAHSWGPDLVPFAIQENGVLENLCTIEGYLSSDDAVNLAPLIEFRRSVSSVDGMKSYLDQFLDVPVHVQHLVVLALKSIVYSTSSCDRLLEEWLEQSNDVAGILKEGSQQVVDTLLEVFAEFQQHEVSNWSIRLPHFLTRVIEEVEDPARINLLAAHVLQLSLNAGIGSPIQRLAASGKWPDWATAIRGWRENLLEVARHSSPWVACRIRSTSATVSHLIGPSIRSVSSETVETLEDEN